MDSIEEKSQKQIEKKGQELISLVAEKLRSLDENRRTEAIKDLLGHDLADIKYFLENTLTNETSTEVKNLAKFLLAKIRQLDFEKQLKGISVNDGLPIAEIGYLRGHHFNIKQLEDPKEQLKDISLLMSSYIRTWDRIFLQSRNDNLRIERTKNLLSNDLEYATYLIENILINDTSVKVRKLAEILSLKLEELKDTQYITTVEELFSLIAKAGVKEMEDVLIHDLEDITDFLTNTLIHDRSIKVKSLAKSLLEKIKEVKEGHEATTRNGLLFLIDSYIEESYGMYEHLLSVINNEEDIESKAASIRDLGRTHDPRAINALLLYSKDEHKEIRMSSASAFRELRSPIAVSYICDLLNDQDTVEKIKSIEALKKIRDPSAIEPLMNLLHDEDEAVRTSAAIALAYLGEPSVFAILEKALENKSVIYDKGSIIETLGVLGDKSAVPSIIDQLNKGDNRLKGISIISLGLLGDRQAIPHLKNLLKDSDEHTRFRAGIVLGYFKVKAAYKIICEALKSDLPYYRASAVRSIAELNGRKYIDLILSAIKDSNTEVRGTALKVFMNVARAEMAFLANYLDLSSIRDTNTKEEFPKSEILDAFQKDYFRKVKIDANRIEVNTIYKILLMIGCIETRSEIIQKLDEAKNETKPERESKSHLFQEEKEYETEEILIDDAWFDRILDTNAVKNPYNIRPKQRVFREKVFERYGAYCAVCGLRVKELLTAAHIIPKESKGVDDPRNALVLCSLHHKAFDSGLFGIEPDTFEIHYKPKGPKASDFNIRYDTISHLHNKPHPDVLRWRWSVWQKMLDDQSNKK